MMWTKKNIPSQIGRRVVITGANTGIGFQVALELARNGAEVVMPARDLAKATNAIDRIKAQIPNAKMTAAVVDLASLESIRSFVKFYSERFPGKSLDVLINNAALCRFRNENSRSMGLSDSLRRISWDPLP